MDYQIIISDSDWVVWYRLSDVFATTQCTIECRMYNIVIIIAMECREGKV